MGTLALSAVRWPADVPLTRSRTRTTPRRAPSPVSRARLSPSSAAVASPAAAKVTCGSTKVANSNKKGGTGKGTSGKSVTVTCDKGFTGGGKLLCSKTKWSWDTGGVCKKAAAKKCPGDADGNKVVNIEDLLILLGSYGKSGT